MKKQAITQSVDSGNYVKKKKKLCIKCVSLSPPSFTGCSGPSEKALKFAAIFSWAQPHLYSHTALLPSAQPALQCILPPGLCMCCCSLAQKVLLSSLSQCIPQSSLTSVFCAIR